jgi:hypothetical protein
VRRAGAGTLALVLAAGLLLAGCGRAPLSTAALRTQARRICRVTLSRESRIGTPTTLAQGAPFLRLGVAALRPELRALRGLDAGRLAAPALHRALAALSAEIGALRSTADSLGHGGDPVSELRLLHRRVVPLQAAADVAWRSLEIPACAAS